MVVKECPSRASLFFLLLCFETLKQKRGFRKMENKELIDRTQKFIDELDLPKTIFCRHIGITPQYLRMWMQGERKLSETKRNAIEQFLIRFGH